MLNVIKQIFYSKFRSPVKKIIYRLTVNLMHQHINSLKELRKILLMPPHKISHYKVSIVIPTLNGVTDGLESLLQSLRAQSHKNIEIIAVDSSSTDGTQALLEKYGSKVISIKRSEFKHDFARNLGAKNASGDFILFTVQDACFDLKEWIEIALKHFEYFKNMVSFTSSQYAPPEAELYARSLSYNFLHSNQYNAAINLMGSSWLAKYKWRYLLLEHLRARRVHIDDTNHMVKKDFFLKNLYDLETCEDMGFGKKVIFANKQFVYSRILSVKHFHSYQGLGKYAKRVFIDNLTIRNILERRNLKVAETPFLFDNILFWGFVFMQVMVELTEKNSSEENKVLAKSFSDYTKIKIAQFEKIIDSNLHLDAYEGLSLLRPSYISSPKVQDIIQNVGLSEVVADFQSFSTVIYKKNLYEMLRSAKSVIVNSVSFVERNEHLQGLEASVIQDFYLACITNATMSYLSSHYRVSRDRASLSKAVLESWVWV